MPRDCMNSAALVSWLCAGWRSFPSPALTFIAF